MAKFLVKNNDVVDAEATADKVLAALESMESELGGALGVDTTEKGDKIAKADLRVSPAKRKDLLARINFVKSAILADTTGLARGRAPLVNLDDLLLTYFMVKNTHPGIEGKALWAWTASTFNNKYLAHNPVGHIDKDYVKKKEKEHGWDQLPVPEMDVATVQS